MKPLVLATALALALPGPAHAQISDGVVKLGVLNDQSGPFSALGGPGSALAVRMAVEDMKAQLGDTKVEVLVADHQNKPDIGVTTARRWFDVDQVDALFDVSNSAVALAVQNLIRERNKVVMYAAVGTTEITGKQCAKTGFSWLHDNYALISGPVRTLAKSGQDTWYFLAADYAFGKNMVEVAKPLLVSSGGRTVGEVYHPMDTADYGAFLLQARASKAKVVAIASGGNQAVNIMKQWREFGMQGGAQKPIALLLFLSDVHAAGLDVAQGLSTTTAWYWDRDDETRAFAKRFFERFKAMPTESQASMYSAASHYLKAVVATKTDATDPVVAWMRANPVNDLFAKNARLREDGKLLHDFLFVTVKTKAESKGPWDLYRIESVTPASDAFPPLASSACPLVNTVTAKAP